MKMSVGFVSGEAFPWLVDSHLLLCSQMAFSLWAHGDTGVFGVSSFFLRTPVLLLQGHTLMISFKHNYFFKGLISKYSHIWDYGFNRSIWGGHNSGHNKPFAAKVWTGHTQAILEMLRVFSFSSTKIIASLSSFSTNQNWICIGFQIWKGVFLNELLKREVSLMYWKFCMIQ